LGETKSGSTEFLAEVENLETFLREKKKSEINDATKLTDGKQQASAAELSKSASKNIVRQAKRSK
jgi:hypothetical protein